MKRKEKADNWLADRSERVRKGLRPWPHPAAEFTYCLCDSEHKWFHWILLVGCNFHIFICVPLFTLQ